MIKKWEDFIKEKIINNEDGLIQAKMNELDDLIYNSTDTKIIYEWENKNNKELIITFTIDNLNIRYEFDIINLLIIKIVNSALDFTIKVESVDEAMHIIEKDIHSIIGISEKRGRPKASYTKSGRKVPGKYLTKNKKAMKKEIEKYRDSDEYKKDWDADYESGKGGEGKRYKTKTSAATKAYKRMFGDDKK